MLTCFQSKKKSSVKICQSEFFEIINSLDDVSFDLWLKRLKIIYPAFTVEESVNFVAEDTTGRTWLHYAVLAKHEYAAQQLLDLGADMNLLDKNGRSALDLAEKENASMYVLLLEFKSNPIYKIGK